HHEIGIHPLKTSADVSSEVERLVPLFDLAMLSEGDRQRSLGLAWQQAFTRPGPEPADSRERRHAAETAQELLSGLPPEFADDAVAAALAQLHFARGETVQAAEAARRVLRLESPSTDAKIAALFPLGVIAFSERRFDEAAEYFSELTGLRRSAGDWYFLGLSEFNSGQAALAIQALETSRQLDPASIETCEALATIYRSQDDRDAQERLRDEIARLKRWQSGRGIAN
ncbi:MAG TPA: hypothetical protein VKU82_10615, partial [Planctomycetaceae bacterium]|nr:hypothetical protein [Planctomycetaceae bacterium]